MKLTFIIILITIIVGISCNSDRNRCLKSAGEEKTVKYDLEYFNKVSIKSDFEVYLEIRETNAITITCGKNLIPYIDYKISNKELIIENKNTCDWLRNAKKPKIIISLPIVKEINIYEACDLKSVDSLKFNTLSIQNWAGIFTTDLKLDGDSLFFRCHASTGDYHLEGECNYAYIYNVGSGYLVAHLLKSNLIHVVHKSLGNSELRAIDALIIEKIEYGKVYSFSETCPEIRSSYNWGDAFVNLGCP